MTIRGQAGGRTLDLDEILADEYAVLYPSSGVRPAQDAADGYAFTAAQLRDIPVLARLIGDSPRAAHDRSPVGPALRAITDGQQPLIAGATAARDPASSELVQATFIERLTVRLNEMLTGDLVTDARFRALHRMAGVVDADADDARRRRANRLLLEAALGPAVARWRDTRLAALHARIRACAPTALCLSGGGIRSCTFALGLVTTLARHGLLGKFDYLSTVSGGGYLGGWLSAWMAHEGASSVQRALAGHNRATLDPEPEPVDYVRAHASFLAPRLGMFSADMWTLIGTLLRNLLLNWLVILPMLAGAIMLPRVLVSFLRSSEPAAGVAQALPIVLAVCAFLLGVRALAYVYQSQALDADRAAARRRPLAQSGAGRTQRQFVRECLAPLIGAAIAFSLSWWFFGGDTDRFPVWVWVGTATAMNVLAWGIGSRARGFRPAEGLTVAASGAAAGLLAPNVVESLSSLASRPGLQTALQMPVELLHARLFVALAVPLVLLLIAVAGQLLIGLSSTRGSNADREWNARFNAWLLIAMITWAAGHVLVLFLPPLLEDGWRDPRLLGLHALGTASGLLAAWLGASRNTPATTAPAQPVVAVPSLATTARRAALALAPAVFAISLVGVLSVFNAQVLLSGFCNAAAADCLSGNAADYAPALSVLATALGLIGGGWLLGRLIDTNEFSLHAMYRSRLVRTFLGASRANGERAPDPFTGFDDRDDMPMAALWPPAAQDGPIEDRSDEMPPLHVVNVTLNVVLNRSLAWQQRKAESMTISALHAGAPFLGFRRTRPGGPSRNSPPVYGGPKGISLGTAVTISGAAASPEAGYNSSPSISFLMALFNARLGCWLGNPGAPGDATFPRSGPRGGVTPVLSEMFGLTTDRSPYVFLSDGGHFDNLGLYSMVLRRCRLILVSDAGCDPERTFEDLGNAIRKIRIDLGVPIEFGDDRPAFGQGVATARDSFQGWAVARIRYSLVDRPAGSLDSDDEYDGVLIYLKPTLAGGEPVDVVSYACRREAFPHESTTDQFFVESQFESYRSLGAFQAERMCQALGLAAPVDQQGHTALQRHPIQWLAEQRIRRARSSAGWASLA